MKVYFSMGLYGTLSGSIFTLSRASDLKFGTHSRSFSVHCMIDVVLRLESKKFAK